MIIFNSIKERLLHYSWSLAYGEYDDSTIMGGIDWSKLHIVINPYKNKWFADPFILSDDENNITFLVEEFDYSIKKGRIAKIIVDKIKDTIVDCSILLELPTHLSFPSIYTIDNKIYILPENSQSGKCVIYEYDEDNNCLTKPVVLVDEPLTDAVILKEENKYYIHSTKSPVPNGNIIFIYESSSFLGPYLFKKSVEFNNDCARMGGQFIECNNRLVRPAQDCNGAYGRAIFFMDDKQCINEWRPSNILYAGLHTFNVKGNKFVIDLKKYDYPYFYRYKELLKRIF